MCIKIQYLFPNSLFGQSIIESRGAHYSSHPQATTLVACNKNYPPSPNKIIDFGGGDIVVLIAPLQT
jgi:hypothetical protein